ncbi:MAG: PilT-like protein [Candidatus Brocadiaceae bacterium]|nr:PilT-like protein [Candidatus Brocadiaceae bacterium]
MKLNDLKAGENVFIDANIFIYSFGAQSVECRELLLRCAKKELTGYTSTSVISEVLHRLMVAEALQKGFINEKNKEEGLLTNDSILVATMKELRLLNLATNDNDFDRIKWLYIYKPSDM